MKKLRKKKKRSLKSRRAPRARKSRALLGSRAGTATLTLSVDGLEIARGNDGFLRGLPEPALVCGLFSVSPQGVSILARAIATFAQPTQIPETVQALPPALLEARWVPGPEAAVIVLVIALEVDGGADLQRAYALLEEHEHLMLLETSDAPQALHLGDLGGHQEPWRTPRPVDLAVNGERFDQGCRSDDWIAAAAFISQTRGAVRARLRSADGKNDWTAKLSLR